MARTVATRLIGAFLLVYGLAAIVMGWWAYSVTHEAFTSVRSFTSAFERERDRAVEAIQGATGLLGGGSAEGSGSSGGPRVLQADGLRDRLRGILGGQDGNQSRGQQEASPAPGQSGGLLDDLQRRLGQAQGSWSVLGEGPFKPGLLDQVELAVNAVLAWMALHGVVSVVIGLLLLLRNPSAAPAVAPPGAWPQPPPGSYPDPYYSRGPAPYPGYSPPASPPPHPGWREDPPTRPG